MHNDLHELLQKGIKDELKDELAEAAKKKARKRESQERAQASTELRHFGIGVCLAAVLLAVITTMLPVSDRIFWGSCSVFVFLVGARSIDKGKDSDESAAGGRRLNSDNN